MMRLMDMWHLDHPTYGSRRMQYMLEREGYCASRERIRRLMRIMNITAIYQKPRTSIKGGEESQVFPYLLRDVSITHPNQVWATDITYIPMKRGFMYLTAYIDWHSRYILSWELSNTMEVSFCLSALEGASRTSQRLLSCVGPDILNTDQGSQYTSRAYVTATQSLPCELSHDGKGRWLDNVMMERFWRSLKYECIYVESFNDGHQLHRAIQKWIQHYNENRPHMALKGATPQEVYLGENLRKKEAKKELEECRDCIPAGLVVVAF
jgi:putative transposase